MDVIEIVSLCLSGLAFILAGWARMETFYVTRRTFRTDLAKRVGEAFVSSQALINKLSYNIDVLESVLNKKEPAPEHLKLLLTQLNEKLNSTVEFGKVLQKLTIAFEEGTVLNTNLASVEATIARLNHRTLVAEYDIYHLNKSLATDRPKDITD